MVAIVLLLGVAAAGAWWFARSRETSHGWVAWFAAFGSIAACVALALFREGFFVGFRPASVFAWTTSDGATRSGDLLGSSQFLLNVALFVPAGVAWTVWVTATTTADVLWPRRTHDADRERAGPHGCGCVRHHRRRCEHTWSSPRRRCGSGNHWRPRAIRTNERHTTEPAPSIVCRCRARCRSRDHADRIDHRSRSSPGSAFTTSSKTCSPRRPTTRSPQSFLVIRTTPTNPMGSAKFVDAEQIFGAISVRSSGARYSDDQIEMRWPALFFGFRRCVFVVWTPAAVEFRDVSGRACTEFIG